MKSATLFALLLFPLILFAQTKDYARHVNPFIGTGGHGHTFPGATVPFGMVQLSPDTRIDNWDGSSGYHYSDDIIYGFSHTHLSGTGIPDGCDILFMPTVGEPQFFAREGDKAVNGYASKFSHGNEKAEPGYYSVKLDDDAILAEMTATTRAGFHRYTFPKTDRANIFLNLGWRDKTIELKARFVSKIRIEGYRVSSSWAKRQIVYFVAEFSKPFERASSGDHPREYSISGIHGDLARPVLFQFNASDGKPILLKVGLSFVSIEGARKNLEAELPHWDFDKVRADAKAAWNKELSKIEVSGGTPEQTTNFYTALYHTMIHPNVFNDIDGRYNGHDGKIHQLPGNSVSSPRVSSPHVSKGSTPPNRAAKNPVATVPGSDSHYTVFSLWDTFRAAHPLYTIIDQKRTADFINTFIRQYEQGGRLPVWELWGEETDTMIGYHAVSVIADAMAKGIKGFDYDKAYEAAKHSAELDHHGLAAYKKRGYISMEDENESVSKTLEYAYNDWCIAQMARILAKNAGTASIKDGRVEHSGDTIYLRKDIERYEKRARYFENLFDPRVGFFVPRKNGGFVRPFAPNEVTFHFTEGNSWQYSFFVPHDITRLMELMGGREYFAGKLIQLFSTDQRLTGREQLDITGLTGQYAHGNEPSHHIPYLFNYAGLSWRTQMYVRKIMDEFYKNSSDGLIGNEDCGQMSAWYVLSAGGFYPVTPGSPVYMIGTPLFPEITYHLENGKTFTVRANNVSDKNVYILNANLNGVPLREASLAHSDIMSGGVLEFTMTDAPVTTAFDELPKIGNAISTAAVPRIERGPGHRIFIGTNTPGAEIYYTVDGSDPRKSSTRYVAPFRLDGDAPVKIIKAIAVNSTGGRSLTAEAQLHKKPNNWTVNISSTYNRQYTGGGDDGLIDGIRGTTNFASGEWQGYQGQDFVAVIDLQRPTPISKVGGSFLQVARSWIWMPTLVEFEVSVDGESFTKIADIKTDVAPENMEHIIRKYSQTVNSVTARYVRVKAHNLGKIPAWHPGAGGEAFIFVDEIIIR